ncbi:putative phage tail protein [Paenibacillus thermotolerans]|uniref:putative phage tail protein n=1 Tax=Paenibacillus thermotolerans TaxID=3027807 RepID=UPI002367CE72|nr:MULTISPECIES: putative phage tail protein [unclassified Paenibacillus]
MSHSEEMIKQLQPFQRKSKVFQGIFEAEEIQFDERDNAVQDLEAQLLIDTATWAIPIYERELGIPTEPNKPIAERRAIVKSKMRGSGKVDAILIKIVADSFTNGDVDVQFDGAIRISFSSVLGTPPNESDLKAAIEEIRPAHLALIYDYRYLMLSEVENMTLEQVENTLVDKFAWG